MIRKIYLLIAFGLLLSGCDSWVRNDQLSKEVLTYSLRSSRPLGQTFTARHAGLQGIELYFAPGGTGLGEVQLSLSPEPGSPSEITATPLQVQAISQPGYYSFTFPSIAGSQGQSYFLQLVMKGPGDVTVGIAPGDSYLDGALYAGGQPEDAQLTFRTRYNTAWLAIGLARQGMNWLRILVLSLWLFLVPGLALVIAFYPKGLPLTWLEKAILGTGVGLAGYPILFLLMDLLGFHPGRIFAYAPPIVGVIYLILHARSRQPQNPANRFHTWWKAADRIPELAALVAIGLVIASRFYPVAGLVAPMWGDSYQHSVITQLIDNHGGLFDSWLPYADLTAFTYHFGFHSIAAVFGWASGETSWQAVLWAGQILNVIAVAGLYPLAVRLSHSRWGGVIALVAAGALAPMPMAYINWGRYTQLAGQAILPIAIYIAWQALERSTVDWRLSFLGWIAWAGLALSHYRVLIFGVLFILAYLAVRMWHPDRLAVIRRLLALSVGAGVLFAPWFLHIFAGRIIDMLVSQLTTLPSSQSAWAQNNLFNFTTLDIYLPLTLWALAAASVVWAVSRKKQDLALIAIWAGVILLAANPDWAGLPGEGALSNFAVFIAAYIPVALLIGGAVGEVVGKWVNGQETEITPFSMRDKHNRSPGNFQITAERVGTPTPSKSGSEQSVTKPQRQATWKPWTTAVLLVILCTWGARERLKDIDPFYGSLVTQPDIRAAQWIKENLPLDAQFHVNQFFAFSDSVTVGADAGWWLPLLAGRSTDLPPINYGFEQTARADYREWTNALPRLIQERGIDHPEVLAAFQQRAITHIYVGQRQGRVNYGGPDILDPDRLLASPAFTPVYHQDRVWIFEITPLAQP